MISEILGHLLGLAVVRLFLGFFLGIAVLEAAYPGILPQPLLNVLSAPINVYLSWCYPIKSADGTKDLPSCAYRWPNGQGDTAKFLQGIENSPRWEKAFGSIYRIWSGTKPEVVLTRPEHLQPAFFDSDQHIKAVNNNSGYLLGELLGKCVGLISPPQWQSVRAVTQPPFLYPACVAHTDRIQEIVRSFFQELELDDTGSLARGLIHPAHDLKMLPFWVVCELFYGRLPWHLVQELKRLAPLRENLMKHAIRGGLARFSWSRYLPTQANRELKNFQSRWRQFNRDVVAQARRAEKPAPIAKMYDAVDRREISEDQLLQTLDEALFANLDVTTGGLSWNLVFLAAHPDCQRKLREEITEATGSGSLNKYLQSQSTYLQACILESSRMKPLAAFSVPQSAPSERVVGGFRIPARTDFIVDAYALNIRSPYWAPDNETYRPERFLDRKNVELRYSFWRFGFGPRQCMGKYAADAVIRTTLVYLLLQYNLSLMEEGDWTRDQESWITHPDFHLYCVKRGQKD
ncbi:cytochrome P450 [Aspergillus novofumigatus IBT 16806]|uniref:Cytochrome P450 n=1 Tax=Aspergillus novofumigatus (strain IBT 16806) TaxID=1392255 RepID=A0A2I1BSV2_ASPN1|nr:cytochrome P450 [Aspergillus novofumigatus IBT 16806]PKX88414.1 cytochrome P450 [Aspergillus novofumigatus IBT 16806]